MIDDNTTQRAVIPIQREESVVQSVPIFHLVERIERNAAFHPPEFARSEVEENHRNVLEILMILFLTFERVNDQ